MLKGIDISQVSEFSTSKDVEPKTVFKLKPLSGLEMLEATQKLGGVTGINTEYIGLLINKAVVGIKNPDIVEQDKIKVFIDGLNPLILMEIVTEIGNMNNITEEEEKN